MSRSDKDLQMGKLETVSNSENNQDLTSSNATVVIVETPPLGGDEKSGQRCVSTFLILILDQAPFYAFLPKKRHQILHWY